MSLSNYREALILKALSEKTLFVQLHVGDPGENCTGNVAAETKRFQGTFNELMELTASMEWPEVSTTEEYTHVSLWDAKEAGNPEVYGVMTAPVKMVKGNDFRIKAGKLKVAVD